MGKISDAVFRGASGAGYKFEAYTLDEKFDDIGAVYIYSKRTVRDGKGSQKFLYIGEAAKLGSKLYNHEKWNCLELNGVNCLCVLTEEDKDTRLNVEADLKKANATPCN